MANPTLSTDHALYGNIVRALSADPNQQILLDAIPAGTADLARQTNVACLTYEQNANVSAAQSIQTDGTYWYEVDTAAIRRSDFSTGSVDTTNSSPFTGLTAGIDHLGDGCVSGGLLYVPAVDYDSGTETSASQTIAVYDTTDLTLDSQIDISGSTDCNAAGLCIGHTGNFFVVSYTQSSGPDNRLVDIYEFNSGGTQIAVHTLDGNIIGMQGIGYDPVNDIYVISSYNAASPAGESIVLVNSSFEIIARLNPTGMGVSEIEGVCYYDGDFYTHETNDTVRRLVLSGLYVHPTTGNGVQFLANADIPDSGSIVIRGNPATLFNYNSLWDNNLLSNDWECWIYSDGRYGGRINSGTSAVSAASTVSAGSDQIFGFSWAKSGATVDYDIVHNGSIKQTRTGVTWVTPPASGLYLGGINAGNTLANFNYTDVLVYDKRLSSTEWSDLAADFDGVYAVAGASQYSPWLDNSNQIVDGGSLC